MDFTAQVGDSDLALAEYAAYAVSVLREPNPR